MENPANVSSAFIAIFEGRSCRYL